MESDDEPLTDDDSDFFPLQTYSDFKSYYFQKAEVLGIACEVSRDTWREARRRYSDVVRQSSKTHEVTLNHVMYYMITEATFPGDDFNDFTTARSYLFNLQLNDKQIALLLQDLVMRHNCKTVECRKTPTWRLFRYQDLHDFLPLALFLSVVI